MIEQQIAVNACVDIHLVQRVIPKFTEEKLVNFTNMVREVANAEVKNNNLGA